MTQIDELVKRLRAHADAGFGRNGNDLDDREAADALEAQAAENERLCERAREHVNSHSEKNARIASLDTQLDAFRKAAKLVRDSEKAGTVVFGDGHCVSKRSWNALMSALRNAEGEKDGGQGR